MGFLREFLVAMTFPLALTLAGLCFAVVLYLLHWQRSAVVLSMLAIGWTLFWSVPRNAEWLRESLEARHEMTAPDAYPTADAIVVLGGGWYGWVKRPDVDVDDLKYSRLAEGVRLYDAGRAPRVILSGGGDGKRSEAETMARGADRLGIPASALLLEERSTDTEGNAQYTARLAQANGVRSILLVTSAMHMPRASRLFRNAGLSVVEAPVPEPPSVRGDRWSDRWIPSPRALWRSGRALKEYAGLLAACVGAKAA